MFYKLITFDITGTLLRGRLPPGETYARAGELFGITGIHPNVLTENFNKEWTKLCKSHPNFGLHSGMGWISWWKNIVKSTFINSSEKHIDNEILDKLGTHLIQMYSSKDGWQCENGTFDLLKYLISKNIQLGVISNFDIRLHNILKELEMDQFFSFVLTSYETAYSKPDINIFKLAQKKYEALTGVELEQKYALHIGNSVRNDVEGALQAKWKSAFVSEESNFVKLPRHAMQFKNLSELKTFFISQLD